MASPIVLNASATAHDEALLFVDAERVFREIDAQCSRFIPGNPLAIVNEAPGQWHEVPNSLHTAIVSAYEAYQETDGLFDPRVLDDIERLGYVDSVTSSAYRTSGSVERPTDSGPLGPWRPEFQDTRVKVGPARIDLGGIGKGLAVETVAALWRNRVSSALINAGGDLAVIGTGPDGPGWRVGVEDPIDRHGDPVAVLEVSNCAVATSSTAIHSWTLSDGRPVHHLIDPRTGAPGGAGLSSVTVIADTATSAETWSKALFVLGKEAISDATHLRNVAAVWIGTDGTIGHSAAAEPLLMWKAPDVTD